MKTISTLTPACWRFAVAMVLFVLAVVSAHAADYIRQNNTSLLNTDTAWGGGPPTSADSVTWDATCGSNRGQNLGGNVDWGQIIITTPGGDITIGNTASSTLTLYGLGTTNIGIDMSSASRNLTINDPVTLGGDQSWTVASGRTLTMGNYALSLGANTLTLSSDGNTTLSGAISSSGGGITKSGSGTLLLNNNGNSYTGKTLVSGGILQIGTAYNGGQNSVPGGYQSYPTNGSNLELNGGLVSYFFAFQRILGNGAGEIQLTGGTCGFVEKQSDRVDLTFTSSSTEVQWGTTFFNPSVLVLNDAAASPTAPIKFNNPLDLKGTNRIVSVNADAFVANGNSAPVGAYGRVNGGLLAGNIRNTSGTAAGLIKTGIGVLGLDGVNTYNGGTTINEGGVFFTKTDPMPPTGTVTVNTGTELIVSVGAGGRWTTGTSGNGTIGGLIAGLGGQSGGTVSYSGNVTLGFNVDNGVQTYTGNIGNVGTTLGINMHSKDGTGSLFLSGNNTYSGATTIKTGSLIGVAGGSCSNSAVTVNNTSGCILGIAVNDNTKQWTCASLTTAGSSSKLGFGFTTTPSTTVAPLNVIGDLTFTGTPTLTVDPQNLSAGDYPLLVYGGTLTGTAPTTATIGHGLTGTLAWGDGTTYSTKTLVLTVSGTSTLPIRWSRNANQNWDINTTTNWSDNTGAVTRYLETVVGDPVIFDETYINANRTVTLTTSVKPASVTVSNTTLSYTIAGNGFGITGNGAVTKDGAGTLTISANANTYSGGFTFNDGKLGTFSAGTFNGFGTGPVTINGGQVGAWVFATGAGTTIPNDINWNATMSASRSGSSGNALVTFDGDITLGSNPVYTIGSATVVVNAIFNGSIGDGAGNSFTFDPSTQPLSVTLNSVNTYTGDTLVASGGATTLTIGGSGCLGSGNYAGNLTFTATTAFNYSSSANQTLSGIISGSSTTLTKDTSGTSVLTLSGPNTYDGATTVSAGKLFINGNQSAANGAVSVSTNATLGGIGTIGGNTTIAGGGILEFVISAAPGSHDPLELAAGKTFNFSGDSVLTITSSGGATTGEYILLTAPGGITGNAPGLTNLPAGWTADAPAIVDGTNLVINITSIGGSPNIPPVANAKTYSVPQFGVLVIEIGSGAKALASDADHQPQPLTFLSLGSPNGFDYGNAVTNSPATSLTYTNTVGTVGAEDVFSYIVTDGTAFATNLITVRISPATGSNLISATFSNGVGYLTYAGIPGTNYVLEWTPSLGSITWTPVQTNMANTNPPIGYLYFEQQLSPSNDFFRTRYLP